MQIHYTLDNGIATLRMDDGKSNALSPLAFRELNAALDRAERDRAIVILTGREQVFSAGAIGTRGDFKVSANEVAKDF